MSEATNKTNSHFHKAKNVKNDEFYTKLIDIKNELKYYEPQLKGKIIYLNCDNRESNFYRYFKDNFKRLGIKELLICAKDFRDTKSIEILKSADIVITNPPFSLFREYIKQLIDFDKKFLIIGNINAVSYKDIFYYIKNNKLRLGHKWGATKFDISNGKEKAVTITWYTNLETNRSNDPLVLFGEYNEIDYPVYFNYHAINVNKLADIPKDYYGIMGVPITYFHKYNPKQFKIIELGITGSCTFTNNRKMEILKNGEPTGKFTKNAKGTLCRIFNPKRDKRPPAFKDVETGEFYSSIYARVLIKRIKGE